MKSTIFADLEKDKKFKRANMPLSAIYKNILVIAPILLIFIGLLGVLFLLEKNQLISYYSIYYIICFILGTIWLKSIRQYIANKNINKENSYLVCWGVPFKEDKKRIYLLFSTSAKRHDKYYIENISKKADTIPTAKKDGYIKLIDIEKEKNICSVSIAKSIIKRRNPNWVYPENLPILYIDDRHVVPVSGRYLY